MAAVTLAVGILVPLSVQGPSAQSNKTAVAIQYALAATDRATENDLNNLGVSTGSNANAAPAPKSPSATDNKDSLGCFSGNLDMCLSGIVYWLAVQIPSFFVFVGSTFFGIAAKLSLQGTSYGMNFVTAGWTVSRDIANMAFLFILIYIAFTIMLNIETGSTMQTLAWVIVIALLVNFSFFFSRVVVDAGNITALQFYNAIPGSTAGENSTLGSIGAKDLSASVMGTLNLQKFLGGNQFDQWNTHMGNTKIFSLNRLVTLTVLYIVLGIIIITLGIAFFTAGVHFLGRIVVLWLLIMISPLAFVAQTIPGLSNYFRQWREMLFKHAFYPAFFFFVYLFLTVFLNAIRGASNSPDMASLFLSQTAGLSTAGGFTDYLYNLGSSVAVIAVMAGLIIIMMKKALEAGDRFGLATGEAAGKVGGWLNNNVMGTYKGTYKWAGGKAFQQFVGRPVGAASKGLEKTSFGRSQIGWLIRREGLDKIAAKSVGGARSATAWKEEEKTRVKARDTFLQKRENLDYIKQSERLAELEQKAQGGALLTAEEQSEKQRITTELPKKAERLKTLNTRELEEMGASNIKKVAGLLSSKQIESIRNSDKISDTDSETISRTWHEESKDSPLKNTHKIIEGLRKIHEDLTQSGVGGRNTWNAKIGTTSNQMVGEKLDAAAVSAMVAEAKSTLDQVRAQQTDAQNIMYQTRNSGGNINAAQANLIAANTKVRQAEDAMKEVEKLREKIKEVPPEVGGTPETTDAAGITHAAIKTNPGEVVTRPNNP